MRGPGLVLALLLLPLLGRGTFGADDWDSSVAKGQKALKIQSSLPWYDASRDELQPVKMKSHKLAEPIEPWDWPDWSLPSWLGDFLSVVVQVIFYAGLAILLVVIVYLLVLLFRRRRATAAKATRAAAQEQETLEGGVDAVENLPFPLARPQGDLLSEAQRWYSEGNYSQAITYLYSYELLQLDKHRLIELTQGKTNRQYLREVRPRRRLAQLIESSMVTFEDAFFGRYAISKERFEACWQGLSEFHQLVRGEAVG